MIRDRGDNLLLRLPGPGKSFKINGVFLQTHSGLINRANFSSWPRRASQLWGLLFAGDSVGRDQRIMLGESVKPLGSFKELPEKDVGKQNNNTRLKRWGNGKIRVFQAEHMDDYPMDFSDNAEIGSLVEEFPGQQASTPKKNKNMLDIFFIQTFTLFPH